MLDRGAANASNITFFNLASTGGIAVVCNCAVNCFYIISGYYITDNETFAICKKRITKVWISTVIYSVCIPLILIFAVCVICIGVIIIISLKYTGDRVRTIADYNSTLMVLQSIAFFLFFSNLKIKKYIFQNCHHTYLAYIC